MIMMEFMSAPMPVFLLEEAPLQQQLQQQHCCQQQQRQHQAHTVFNGGLQFELTCSSGRRAAAPFARLSTTQQATEPQELFTLSRLSDGQSFSGSSSDVGPSSNGGSSSGYESDTDTDAGYSSDLHLDKINCQICNRPLNQRPGKRRLLSWPWGGSTRSKGHSCEFLVCDCCQRCYHRHCCKQHGISTRERGGVWFHDSSCKECLERLQDKVAAGAVPVSGGRSWQLIDCAPVDPQGPGGVKALQALKQNLSDVLEVMLPAFGPGAAQQLVDTSKGYAVLLKKGSVPLTAGLMDVYGKELAVLDLVATALEHKGEGHCRTLLQALEGWLGPNLGVATLVAVCPADEPRNVQLWQQKFGFKKVDARTLKALKSSVPALNFYEESTLLSKPLAKQHKSGAASSKQQRQKAGKGEAAPEDKASSLIILPLEVSAPPGAPAST